MVVNKLNAIACRHRHSKLAVSEGHPDAEPREGEARFRPMLGRWLAVPCESCLDTTRSAPPGFTTPFGKDMRSTDQPSGGIDPDQPLDSKQALSRPPAVNATRPLTPS